MTGPAAQPGGGPITALFHDPRQDPPLFQVYQNETWTTVTEAEYRAAFTAKKGTTPCLIQPIPSTPSTLSRPELL
jgi:hypothetical protein